MKRAETDRVKAQCKELLHRIDVLERVAGWSNYSTSAVPRDPKKKLQHPEDIFNYGQYTASVKRSSMDLTRSLVELRR